MTVQRDRRTGGLCGMTTLGEADYGCGWADGVTALQLDATLQSTSGLGWAGLGRAEVIES